MKSRDFAFWLQGFFEVADPKEISQEQTEMIKRHLSLVFVHEIDPTMGSKEHQEKLNSIHKPSLEELGKEHNFEVLSYEDRVNHGNQPHPDWKLSKIHGWYDPKEGIPRC